MKIDYIKSVMQFIKDDNELSSPLDNQEWDDFLEKLGQLANTLEEYYTPDNEGNYKTLDEAGKARLDGLFKDAIKSTDVFLKQPFSIDDMVNDKVRKQLAENINKEFLSQAYVEYQNAEVRNDKSLKEMMDNFRNRNIPMTSDEIKKLGGNLSSRINLTVEIDGEKVNGVFTKNTFFDIDKDRNELINDMIFRYPKYKEYFEALNDTDMLQSIKMVSTNAAIVDGQVNPNFLNEVFDLVELDPELYDDFRNDEEFVHANIELIHKANLFKINEGVNVNALGLQKGDTIDKRNSAMSGIAHILGNDNLLAKSRPMTIEMNVDGRKEFVNGTFMDFAKGKDVNNLPVVDKMREAKPEDFDTPEAKKAIANLQVIDYICGNVDRHGGNMFYQFDPNTNKLVSVQGIDNDASFFNGTTGLRENLGQFAGVNLLKAIDSEMALKVLALEEETFKATLLGYGLKKEEIKSAWDRTKSLQEAIKRGITYENDNKLNSAITATIPTITIMDDNSWNKVSLQTLGANANNTFARVFGVASSMQREASAKDVLEIVRKEKEAALRSKLAYGNSLYAEARASKPLFGTSNRYQNVLNGLSRYNEVNTEKEKFMAIDELDKFVNTYKTEKVRDGVLDEKGNLLRPLTGKDLARINLVKKVDNFVKVARLMLKERDEAKKAHEDDVKRVDEINATYRRGKYVNYAKCYRDENGKVLVDREILNRDETVDRDMVKLTEKMIKASNIADTSNDMRLADQKRQEYAALKEYRDEAVNNLKSQLLTEYNFGRVPKEYYDFRLNLLENNIFGETAVTDFAAADPNSPIFNNTFQQQLKNDVDEEFIDNNIEQDDNEININNELDNSDNN